MPIVGSTRYNETITSMRPEEPWFHPTVVTTSTSGTFPPDNMPDLTTVYTPPPSCVNRWMLPNVLGAVPTVYSTSPIASNGRQMGQDSFYLACQRFSTLTYSPGVCTDAQAIVEMTEVRTTGVTGDVGTFWQASCCNSGMTFGSAYSIRCISTFSTPITAYMVVSPRTVEQTFATSSLGPRAILDPSSILNFGEDWTTMTTTLTSGVAIAQHVVVAWSYDDLASFPPAYASSLAQKMGTTFTATSSAPVTVFSSTATSLSASRAPTTSESSSDQPRASNLSTGAKTGIIVGVVLGAALAISIFLLYIRRRRKDRPVKHPDIPEMGEGKSGQGMWFLGGRWRREMDSKIKAQELDANGEDHELDGEGVQQELDSVAVNVVPGPPAELDAWEDREHVHLPS